jgi:DNA integrity scanning protein DisA with diadenylate cyclase activity
MLQAPFELQLTDVVDMLLVATFLWAAVAWLRKTRARLALLGILFLALVYLVARGFELQLTAWILQGFFAVSVIVVVVVFQEDLRRFFEQIAVWGLGRRPAAAPPDLVDLLVRAVARLASGRRGALLVLPGREPLDRHVEGGISLQGKLSEALLLSLFDPNSCC